MQIVWRANFLDTTGYSTAARGYVIGLAKIGVNIRIENFHNPYAPRVIMSPEHEQIINSCMYRPLEKDFIYVPHTIPQYFSLNSEARANIGMTVWETSKLPEEWTQQCNLMDGILVPSYHNLKIFSRQITRPVEYARHGVFLNDENFIMQKPYFLHEDLPKVKFLSIFQWSKRKGYDILLRAFWEEFSKDDDVCLIIKTYSMNIQQGEFPSIIQEISNLKIKYGFGGKQTAPIYISGDVLPTEQIQTLYRMCDCFVLPSRGEGVGLPYLEACEAGIPVIATGWGGQTDFLNSSNSYPIQYDLVPVEPSPYYPTYRPTQDWAESRYTYLAMLIRKVYDNLYQAKIKGAKGRETIEKMFTWNDSAIDIYNAIYRLTGEKLL